MKALLIESATEKNLLLLVDEKRVVASRSLMGGSDLSRRLAQEVAEFIEIEKFIPDQVVVGQGPGSYTGIRVGVALGQSLAYGWDIPIRGIGSLVGFAPPIVEGPFAILLDARSGGFYAQFGKKEKGEFIFDPPFLLKEEDACLALAPFPHIASPHPNLIKMRLKFDKIWFETAPNPNVLSQLISETEGTPLNLTYCSSP